MLSDDAKEENLKLFFHYKEQEVFSYLSFVFAKELYDLKLCQEKHLLFLTYLFASSQKGHHCVFVQEDSMQPSIETISLLESKDPVLEHLIISGSKDLPETLVLEEKYSELKPLAKMGSAFYLQKDFWLETKILEEFVRLLKQKPSLVLTSEKIEEGVQKFGHFLSEEQKNAVRGSLKHSFFLLTGGPGTGKSYTVTKLVKIYLGLCEEMHKAVHVTLVAPTGKACARLKEAILYEYQNLPSNLTISTIHHCLSLRSREDFHKEYFFLGSDLIVVDESSMLDFHLWFALLSSIQNGARVLFLGDPHQLPSIEKGGVFQEIAKQVSLLKIPHFHLKQCLRSDQKELINFSEDLLQGKAEECKERFLKECDQLKLIECDERKNIFELYPEVMNGFDGFFSKVFVSVLELIEHLKIMKSYIILSPLRLGVWGTSSINQFCNEQQLKLIKGTGWLACPIMITKNNAENELFNGDMGYLLTYISEDRRLDKTTEEGFFITADGKIKRIPSSFLPPFEYAYAISIHKSQGSEFSDIVIVLPKGSERFGREILYTAVTRAKKSVKFIGSFDTVQKMIQCESTVHSQFKNRLIAALQ